MELGGEAKYNLQKQMPSWEVAAKGSCSASKTELQVKCNDSLDLATTLKIQATKCVAGSLSQQVNLKKLLTNPQNGLG